MTKIKDEVQAWETNRNNKTVKLIGSLQQKMPGRN